MNINKNHRKNVSLGNKAQVMVNQSHVRVYNSNRPSPVVNTRKVSQFETKRMDTKQKIKSIIMDQQDR